MGEYYLWMQRNLYLLHCACGQR